MKSIKLLPALICAIVIALPSFALAAQQTGTVKVFKVDGIATLEVPGNPSKDIKKGEAFIAEEGTTIKTAAGATVVLMFSNGSIVTVSPDTVLDIVKFTQEPFESKRAYNKLKADPSESHTMLNLKEGTIIGHVKKLTATSKYEVRSAAGAAGIRGTVYKITVTKDAAGTVTMTTVNIDGTVEIRTVEAGSAFSELPAGETIQIELKMVGGKPSIKVMTPTTMSTEDTKKILVDVYMALKEADPTLKIGMVTNTGETINLEDNVITQMVIEQGGDVVGGTPATTVITPPPTFEVDTSVISEDQPEG